MKKEKYIDIWIDKLTNSIENSISGEIFPTIVTLVSMTELKFVTKLNGWNFNWRAELKKKDRQLYKLTTTHNPTIIQGLISLKIEDDHVFVNIIENAPFNIGKSKLYKGVPANLIAYACKLSWDLGNQGAVAFVSKTKLIKHYEVSLGALHLGNQRMVILPMDALNLIKRYFLNQK
ncbi:MAG TPA: hypothetical protein PKD18_03975 [Saprospiraceae bacterium]|nr:hypothetical protein [Saprospiraceae bacterium]